MRIYATSLTTLTAVLLLAAAAWAGPNVEIKIKTEREKVVTKDGQKVKKMVAAKSFTPGESIQYTILYRNTGNEEAANVVISDPIPKGTVYIPGSATDTAELTFSTDGGKTFKKQALLTYEAKGANDKIEKRVASPEDYTDIRWVISKIPAGANGKVGFQVKVK